MQQLPACRSKGQIPPDFILLLKIMIVYLSASFKKQWFFFRIKKMAAMYLLETSFESPSFKLRWLVVRNWIVHDSDADSKTAIESTIAILIKLWFLFDWSQSIKIKSSKKSIKRSKKWMKRSKSAFISKKSILIEKVDLFYLFLTFNRCLSIEFKLFD